MPNKNKIALLTTACLAVLSICLFYYYQIQTTWVETPPYLRSNQYPAKTLVVVYSRTGNTYGAAKEVARYFDADLLQIEAPQYAMNIEGQMRASKDADNQVTTTPITHAPVDPSKYDLIVLCAPTWWFRPAPPLWSFVKNHDFFGKQVLLVMTGNSRYKKSLTDGFADLVKSKHGDFLDLLFIRRGRIYWQKTPYEVNQEIFSALKNRKELYHSSATTK